MIEFTTGLRARVLLLVLLAVIPPVGLIAYSAFNARQKAAANAETSAMNLVQLVAREQERLIGSTRQLLISLSKLPELHNPTSMETCHQTLAAVAKPFSYYLNIGMARPDGTVICRATGRETSINIFDRGYFQRAVQTRDFGIGDYQIGRITHKNTVNFGQAVLDHAGNIKSVVYAALDLTWLNQMIAAYELPPESVLTIVDSHGTVLASSPDFRNPVGTSIRDSDLYATLLAHAQGATIQTKGPDGEKHLYAFTPIHRSPNGVVYIVAGMSQAIVFAAANKELALNLTILVLVAISVLAAAWIGTDVFVIRPVGQLESEVRIWTDEITSAKEEVEKASEAKSHFFTAANHDLRQPLHALALLLDVLDRRTKQRGTRLLLDQMNTALNTLESLVEAVLNISELESGKLAAKTKPVSVTAMFERLRSEFALSAETKSLKLTFRSSDIALKSDAALLERILQNLISNAIKYTEHGSVLVVCRASAHKKIATLEVFDTGIGISDNEMPYIFEDFYQTQTIRARKTSGGRGLGLGIVKRLAQLLNHPIEVSSRPDRGSRFTVRVPLSDEPFYSADVPELEHAPVFSLRGRTILVVDDEDIVLDAMKTLLQDWDARVVTARSSAELHGALRQTDQPVDFLIADDQLGYSFSAADAIRLVREHAQRMVPCAIITGNISLIPPSLACMEGIDVFAKPVAPAKLRTLLHSHFALPVIMEESAGNRKSIS